MVFNKNIKGEANEVEFVKFLDKKNIYELNPMFSSFIYDLFGCVDDNAIIRCYKNSKKQKSDIFIHINDIKKGISIKKGVKNSVHVEGISDFINFLLENGVSKTTINEYLKYHYADGTTNGTGKIRLSCLEYKRQHQEKVDLINLELNKKELLLNAIDRFVLLGRNSNKKIDAILFGVVNDFIWIKSDDIIKVILKHQNDYSTAVHFGPLTCQPMNRCINRNPLYEKERFCVQLKWYNLVDDIIWNMNDNCYLNQNMCCEENDC